MDRSSSNNNNNKNHNSGNSLSRISRPTSSSLARQEASAVYQKWDDDIFDVSTRSYASTPRTNVKLEVDRSQFSIPPIPTKSMVNDARGAPMDLFVDATLEYATPPSAVSQKLEGYLSHARFPVERTGRNPSNSRDG